MAKKKTFEISSSLVQALGETVSAAKNYSGELNIDVVPLSKIELDPDNPRELILTFADLRNGLSKNDNEYARKVKEKEALETIADSIKKQGVLNPIIVYKSGDKYRLVAGERRTLASILCNKIDIQARVLEGKPSQFTLGILQWIENVERKDLTLWERLRNIEKIMLAFAEEQKRPANKIAAADISSIIGCSLQLATNYKSVLEAQPKLKAAIQNNEIKNLEKAALISRATFEKQDELVEACLKGATLKDLKKLAEKKIVPLLQKKQETRGRQASCVNFGITKDIKIAKCIIDSVLKNEQFCHLKAHLPETKWDNFDDASQMFKMIIKLLENQIN